MSTIDEIMEIMDKVETEKKKQLRELKYLDGTRTFFKRFILRKIECKAKIEVLTEIENWLKKELKKEILIYEIEL